MSTKCGNSMCGRSTGIHEGLTFGSGELDEYGYWEKPCGICAADWDLRIEETKARVKEDMIRDGSSEAEADEYVRTAYWLNCKGWPFA